MSRLGTETASKACESFGSDRVRLLDVLISVQGRAGCVDSCAIDEIASALGVSRLHVEGVVSFYSFLSFERRGKFAIRLCNDVVDRIKGADSVAASLEEELGIGFGETTADGLFSLEYASCIGMSDQAPAALVNDVVVPRLGPTTARRGIQILRERGDSQELRELLIRDYGDGNNSHDLVRSAVQNNLRHPGPVIFAATEPGAALRRALSMSPVEVIREIKTSRLRGRGGAGFPTGMKWEFTRAAGGPERYLICNADEGEPGTFTDRVILTERPDLVLEGMTVAGYAIGARQGIVYLRGEYAYLERFLQSVIDERRSRGLLGANICGRNCFDFDVRIQLGAGAYICGEETALINSMEGVRGEPRTRPPFPAQEGYRGRPTAVNNVETLCCAARILDMGSGWFSSMGTSASTGTKLLSVSGDVRRPGLYEVPFGLSLRDVLDLCGADRPAAVQVGGPSGLLVGESHFERAVCFDDLNTAGAVVVFNPDRNVVEIAAEYLRFFVHESCGYCTPCRVGNVLMLERLEQILAGSGEAQDLAYLEDLAKTVAVTSRCGLGQTAPNPVLSSLASFRSEYEKLLVEPVEGRLARFSLESALGDAKRLAERESVHFESEEVL